MFCLSIMYCLVLKYCYCHILFLVLKEYDKNCTCDDTNIVYDSLQTAYSSMTFNVLYDTQRYVIGPAHC